MVLLMVTFTQGNLLDADVEALVNTVNTVGVMGKGIALMFKEAFPENFRAYEAACKRKEVAVGRMFVTERVDLINGPKWIINFPTKKHWRHSSKLEWIQDGLEDLRALIQSKGIHSIALPPLGSGSGGLDWKDVRPLIVATLGDIPNLNLLVYEPTPHYQNVAKKVGLEKLTPARALTAELVRRYAVLGFECTLLEIHKLVYLLQRCVTRLNIDNPMSLTFQEDKFGPYAPVLGHLLNGLDGSYLHCSKRVADAGPLDLIWFEDSKKTILTTYLSSEAKQYTPALEVTSDIIDGFESPLGLETLATVDWLLHSRAIDPNVPAVRNALRFWLDGGSAAERKLRLFEDELIGLAIERLSKKLLVASP